LPSAAAQMISLDNAGSDSIFSQLARKIRSSRSLKSPPHCWRMQGESARLPSVDEGRKRVLLIAASILAARKLAQYGSEAQVPATICAIEDAIRWAERMMK